MTGTGFYDSPVWSPDSLKIAYNDNSGSLFYVDLKTGNSKKVAAEIPSCPRPPIRHRSPDSRWLVYTLNTKHVYPEGLRPFARAGQVHPDHRRH